MLPVDNQVAFVVVGAERGAKRFLQLGLQGLVRCDRRITAASDGFQQLVDDLPDVEIIGQRFGVRLLCAEPGLEHLCLEAERGLELRQKTRSHRGFDLPAHEEPDDRKQQHGDDGPDPDLFLEKQAGP